MRLSAKTEENLKSKTKQKLKEIIDLLNKKELKINLSKTKIMNVNKMNTNFNININDIQISQSTNIKLLGITMTNKLSLINHYKNKKNEIQKNLNLLKTFSSKNGGAHPETIQNIYTSFVKS